MLTQEFIAGYVSAFGSFLEYKRGNRTYFAFQIKTTIGNKSLLDQIAATIELNNRVYCYTGKLQSYSLLIVRDRQSLLTKVIPFFDKHLFGEKEGVFNAWKDRIMKNSSTWNYRNIKSPINPQGDTIVDKNPNTTQIKRG
jgi:LAGLIDADG endonuclease.